MHYQYMKTLVMRNTLWNKMQEFYKVVVHEINDLDYTAIMKASRY